MAHRILMGERYTQRLARICMPISVLVSMIAVPPLAVLGWIGLLLPETAPLHQIAWVLLMGALLALGMVIIGAQMCHVVALPVPPLVILPVVVILPVLAAVPSLVVAPLRPIIERLPLIKEPLRPLLERIPPVEEPLRPLLERLPLIKEPLRPILERLPLVKRTLIFRFMYESDDPDASEAPADNAMLRQPRAT